jgi:hypothetical protein
MARDNHVTPRRQRRDIITTPLEIFCEDNMFPLLPRLSYYSLSRKYIYQCGSCTS